MSGNSPWITSKHWSSLNSSSAFLAIYLNREVLQKPNDTSNICYGQLSSTQLKLEEGGQRPFFFNPF